MDSSHSIAPGRDPFMPQPPKVRGRAITLAVLAHVLLILAIAFGVNWRNTEPTTVSAELWSTTPQTAAPRAVEPPPTPAPEPKKPEPVAKPVEPVVAPPKPEPTLPDPQIAIEKAKREEAQRVAAEQALQKAKREKAEQERAERLQAERDKAEREKRAQDELAQKKAAAEKAAKLKADKEKAEKAERAEAVRQAAAREAYLKRMQGLAGATGGPADTGTALHSSGPSASYAGRIMARIKPNIVFTEAIDGNPMATVEVKLAPDGAIIARRLIKSSGVKSWDEAVLRAIDRTGELPRDVDGRVPPPFQIDFRPRD
jgi:colicin import membrane protein